MTGGSFLLEGLNNGRSSKLKTNSRSRSSHALLGRQYEGGIRPEVREG